MSPRDRSRFEVGVLVVLVAVLVWTVATVIRSTAPASAPVAAGSAAVAKAAAVADQNARIRLDLLESRSGADSTGRSNLFQYRLVVPPAVTRPSVPVPPAQAPARVNTVSPPPPVPSSIPFRYDGYASGVGGKMTAFISDLNNSTNHYNVAEGEVLMGRYRVSRITESLVEIEDLQSNRRQSFARVPR